MKKFQKIEEYKEPAQILNMLSTSGNIRHTEMSGSDLAFLCGLLKKFRPHKIVEVGVAAGGTTAVMINCIHQLQLECQMYSVDLSERHYCDNSRETGYLVKELEKQNLDTSMHEFMLGQVLAARLDTLGQDIDFLILDTMHIMPGEVLDFLVALPYLKKGAIVVVHDTNFQFMFNNRYGFATSVLFHSAAADKFLNNKEEYPNIAAFQLNGDTEKYIQDVFASLMIPWSYIPEKEQMEAYKKTIARFYDKECMRLLEQAEKASEIMIKSERTNPSFNVELFLRDGDGMFVNREKRILIYGMGQRGNALWNYIKGKVTISGFVLSDGQEKRTAIEDKPIYYFSEIPYEAEDVLIILAANSAEIEQTLKHSDYNWAKISESFWGIIL